MENIADISVTFLGKIRNLIFQNSFWNFSIVNTIKCIFAFAVTMVKTFNVIPAAVDDHWWWSKHWIWCQRGFSPRSRVTHRGSTTSSCFNFFTRCAQLYKNSHGFPGPVKPSTKSAPRYFSSAGHVKSTVDPSRDTGEPPAAWTFYTAPHELY